jgi:cytochrome b involved in lipid metabolism
MKKVFLITLLAAGLFSAGCNKTPSSSSNNSSTSTGSTGSSTGSSTYSFDQVKAANNAQKCWTVINGKVYNLTNWINQHPGGPDKILSICGKDGTSAFETQHSGDRRPQNELQNFYIGDLK